MIQVYVQTMEGREVTLHTPALPRAGDIIEHWNLYDGYEFETRYHVDKVVWSMCGEIHNAGERQEALIHVYVSPYIEQPEYFEKK